MITAFESEFVTLKIHHKKVKAVKVLVKLVRKRSGKETDFYAEYYVPGMGLYKTTDPSGRVPVEVVADQTYVKDIPQVK
ncbi:MAG: hypothetical protein JSS79_18605 [Bacteroidetes bacterium]|nr:hypothetical protein [Bacteroidota bacterium]